MSKLAHIVSTGFGTGFTPIAPGTAGSALAAIVFWIISPVSIATHITMISFTVVIGIISSTTTEKEYGKDSGRIVIDEIAGYWISVLMLPPSVVNLVIAFFIFRIFDIIKPFPANVSQNWKGGLGVMADDVFAGIYTNIVMHAGIWIWGYIQTGFTAWTR